MTTVVTSSVMFWIAAVGLICGVLGLWFGLLTLALSWRSGRPCHWLTRVGLTLSTLSIPLNAYQVWKLWPS